MAGFYRPPPELLSQGDIVENVPWGLIEAPITLCRPNNNPLQGTSRHSTVEPWQMHGSPKPWTKPEGKERLHAIGWNGITMILWHDCQISKAENQRDENASDRAMKEFAGVAPVLPLAKLQARRPEDLKLLQDGIRNGENQSYFFLPAIDTGSFKLPESYVNFRYIWPIRQAALSQRVVSLDEAQRPALYGRLFCFLTRLRLDVDPRCSSCGAPVPLEMKAGPLEDD